MKRAAWILAFGVAIAALVAASSRARVRINASGDALLTLAVRYVSQSEEVCRKASEEEKAKMLPHMRREEICERGKKESRVRLWVDGKEALDERVKPLGLRSDGVSVLLHSYPLTAGAHPVRVTLEQVKSSEGGSEGIAEFSQEIKFEGNRRYLIEYQSEAGFRLF